MIQGLTVLFGVICGFVANWVGLPLPWMLGPMIGATLASSFGLPIRIWRFLAFLALPVVGVMLGSYVTDQLLEQAGQFALTLVVLIPFIVAAGGVSYLFYRRVAGFDPVTSYYAAMPGGLNDMMILGEEAGGDARRIALAHAARVLFVIGFVALFFGLFLDVRSQNAATVWHSVLDYTPTEAIWLIAAALIGIPVGKALKLPAPIMFGPMILSGAVHVSGMVTVPPPNLLVIAAQIILGLRIGSRFAGVTFRDIIRDLGFGALSSILMILVALAFAAAVSALVDVSLSQSFLAFSPGGFVEMSLLALALGQEVAYVSVVHVIRIILVVFGASLAFRVLGIKRHE